MVEHSVGFWKPRPTLFSRRHWPWMSFRVLLLLAQTLASRHARPHRVAGRGPLPVGSGFGCGRLVRVLQQHVIAEAAQETCAVLNEFIGGELQFSVESAAQDFE